MYNDIIKEEGYGNHFAVKMLSCNFVAQLLTMDLWAHRLYSRVFIDTVTEASKWSIENNPNCQFKTWEEFVDKANNKNLEIAIIRNMVLDYQKHISDKSKKEENISNAA